MQLLVDNSGSYKIRAAFSEPQNVLLCGPDDNLILNDLCLWVLYAKE